MPIVSTNFAWKHEYDVKLWRQKQRTPNTNDHHMPQNETPHEKFLRTPLLINLLLLRHIPYPLTRRSNDSQQVHATVSHLW